MPKVESPHESLRVPDEHVEVHNRFEFDWTLRPMTYVAPNFGVDQRLLPYFAALRILSYEITREHRTPVVVFEAIPGCDEVDGTFASIIVRWQSERGTFLQHYVPREIAPGEYVLYPGTSGATILVSASCRVLPRSLRARCAAVRRRLNSATICAAVAEMLRHLRMLAASILVSCCMSLFFSAVGVILMDIVAYLFNTPLADSTTQNTILCVSFFGYLVTIIPRDYGVVWLPPVKEFFFWFLAGERT